MLDLMVTPADFVALVNELGRKRRIIGPVARGDRYFYEEVGDAARLELGFSYAVYGPKSFLFPAVETLFRFEADNGSFTAEPVYDDRPAAFVGVHPCDLHAIRLLDRVFAQDRRDEHYLRRRGATMIIGIDCARPCNEGVFCADMKCHQADEGFDVMLLPLSDGDGNRRWGLKFGSAAGREWLTYSRRCTAPTAADERAAETFLRAKAAAFPRALTTRVERLPELLERSYDSLLWEATARRCYSCGSCNLTCPTCYCFDMSDSLDLSLTSGVRQRLWDGCQLPGFALVAGNHNFRPRAAQRLRHRIFRKAKWIRERTGVAGCVGCGRCDRACTAKISAVEIYNQLAELD
ncbi:MAG: 4Fe-4S dicluster domain-containing protein [Phycisphaerae bacterium]|nr:4Fe-4S dicluster domain-containing protein [Phycisphaerae bacterium]NUQ45635.1 4Fe-4S dicluster domain-containing protein [Phycisphaerae bacterium]